MTLPPLARHATVATPPGPFTVIVETDADGRDVVLASGWTADIADLLPVVHASLRPAGSERVDDLAGPRRGREVLRRRRRRHRRRRRCASARARSYQEAWEVLRTVPAGRPDTYAAFAARCGRPAAVRAAANACARNAAALFVPCHRVLGSDGGLGGFRWGTPVKRWLLDHEAAHAPVAA